MLKKTITYEDFNGEEVSEDFFFNISKAELVELEVGQKGGFGAMLQRVVESNDGTRLVAEFKKFILLSYGKKSEDGKRFIKSEELRTEFMQTAAFDALFVEMATDAGAAAEFVNGIVPKSMRTEAGETDPSLFNSETVTDNRPLWIRENREPTDKEIRSMSKEEMFEAFKAKITGKSIE